MGTPSRALAGARRPVPGSRRGTRARRRRDDPLGRARPGAHTASRAPPARGKSRSAMSERPWFPMQRRRRSAWIHDCTQRTVKLPPVLRLVAVGAVVALGAGAPGAFGAGYAQVLSPNGRVL